MSTRTVDFALGEIYHCYNRGVEKRTIFLDSEDFSYFFNGLCLYNSNICGKKMRSFGTQSKQEADTEKLASILAYCLNKNHFHLLIREEVEGGISKFMQRVLTSYVMYFNKKYERVGTLFQGKFQSRHVDYDTYLQHIGVYININNLVHGISDKASYRSSLEEYKGNVQGFCDTELLIPDECANYESYALSILPTILEQKELMKELKNSEYID